MSHRATTPSRSKRKNPETSQGESHLIEGSSGRSVQLLMPIESAFHLKTGLSDLITQAGTLLIQAFMHDEVERLAGPRYAHEDGAEAYRHGQAEGHVIVAGKKVPIYRPRIRNEDGEVTLTTYDLFSDPRTMQEEAYKAMMLGISTRDYRKSVEDFGEGYGIEKSSVSRHFQEASARQLAELAERPLTDSTFPIIMIDGVHFAGVVIIVALGIKESGEKQVLGMWTGPTEHSEVVGSLLDDLQARGLTVTENCLFVIDGSAALAKGIRSRFGKRALIQRCRVHKMENILKHLPKQYHAGAKTRLHLAWGCIDHTEAKRHLTQALEFLEGISTSAARSLEEAFEQTLTVQLIKVPAKLQPYLSNTNMIENLFSSLRRKTKNVKKWQDKPAKGNKSQDMRERWAAAGLLEAEKRFKRVREYRLLTEMAANLKALDLKLVSA